MDKFCERHMLSKLTEKKVKIQIAPYLLNKLNSNLKYLTKKIPGLMASLVNASKTFKEGMIQCHFSPN